MFEIRVGDVREKLREMPDESVHCVVTSPPYWGLRDYNVEGQLGLESTIGEFVSNMVDVFREVRRVRRKDGTLWLNMGDCYSAAGWECKRRSEIGLKTCPKEQRGRGKSSYRRDRREREDEPHKRVTALKNKDLVGQPWRLAFALQADGWYLRSDIIWHKPNPMPESVTDRPTKSHEYVLLLTKAPKYFFDQEAVREPCVCDYPPAEEKRGQSWHKHDADGTRGAAQSTIKRDGVDRGHVTPSGGRNIRSVWTIPTQSFPEAHFATFPERLVEPCIKAGTSEKGCCPECGKPWVRAISVSHEKIGNSSFGSHRTDARRDQTRKDVPQHRTKKSTETTGWREGCECGAPPQACTVLDPFMGPGTTGLVALKLGRRFVGIELNPEYAEMARRRIDREVPLLAMKGVENVCTGNGRQREGTADTR